MTHAEYDAENAGLLRDVKLLLTDRFLDKLVIAARALGDEQHQVPMEQFIGRVFRLAGKYPPRDLTLYLPPVPEHDRLSNIEACHELLLMRGFL